jgi:predicted DNA-binding transcriptional regulator YafY
MVPTDQVVVLFYVDERGETCTRRVLPERIWFGCTDWHREPQWLLDAFDVDRRAVRSFAMQRIEQMRPDTTDRVHDGPAVACSAGRAEV